MYEIIAYKCGYCSRVSIHKETIKDHEKWCLRNPNRVARKCAVCGKPTKNRKKFCSLKCQRKG